MTMLHIHNIIQANQSNMPNVLRSLQSQQSCQMSSDTTHSKEQKKKKGIQKERRGAVFQETKQKECKKYEFEGL